MPLHWPRHWPPSVLPLLQTPQQHDTGAAPTGGDQGPHAPAVGGFRVLCGEPVLPAAHAATEHHHVFAVTLHRRSGATPRRRPRATVHRRRDSRRGALLPWPCDVARVESHLAAKTFISTVISLSRVFDSSLFIWMDVSSHKQPKTTKADVTVVLTQEHTIRLTQI